MTELMLLYGIVPAFVLGVVTGGRVGNLSALRLKFESVLVVLLILVTLAPSLDIPLSDSLLVVVAWIFPVVVCIVVAVLNLKTPGFALMGIGLLLNLIVVAANSGMPVLASNIAVTQDASSATAAIASSWLHIPVDPDTRMLILADVIPTHGPKALRAMLSVGDLLLMIGVGRLIFMGMHQRKASFVGLEIV